MGYNISVSGLWFLKDSAATAELPEEFYKEYNISGRVYKYGTWIDFESLYISYWTGSTYIGMGVDDQGLIDPGTGWWGGFETYRYIDFGDASQEIDETLYNFLMLNAEQMNYNSVFTTVSGTYKFNHNINLFEMYTLDSVFYEGSMYGSMHKAYVVVPALAYGEMVGWNDEDFTNNNLSPENLVLIWMHQNTEEEILDLQLIYANNEWIKPEYQTFTFTETQEWPLERANDLLKYAIKVTAKGPNYTALNDALDRLAAAIAAKTGAELPLTLEEMLAATKENDIGGIQTVNVTLEGAGGELSNETSVSIKFQTASRELNYLCFSGGSPFRDNIRPDNPVLLKVQPVAYIWQSKEDSLAGYKINGSALINAGVGYENATEVVLKDGDVITLVSTNLD